MISRQQPFVAKQNIIWFTMPDNPRDYSHQLYDILRQADESDTNLILIEQVPEQIEWAAIIDRISKATH